jgi:hypothetical protein
MLMWELPVCIRLVNRGAIVLSAITVCEHLLEKWPGEYTLERVSENNGETTGL